MKIYTRRGDAGQTDLFGGDRVGKDAVRVAAYGDVDETNAAIGLAVATGIDSDLENPMAKIQSTLFDLGASLATPNADHREKAGVTGVAAADVLALEELIDRLETKLEELKDCWREADEGERRRFVAWVRDAYPDALEFTAPDSVAAATIRRRNRNGPVELATTDA